MIFMPCSVVLLFSYFVISIVFKCITCIFICLIFMKRSNAIQPVGCNV